MLAALAPLWLLPGCSGSEDGGGGGDITFTRNAEVGARYGSAGPRSCQPMNVPTKGPPSPAQAAAYVICHAEGESGGALYLVDELVITDIGPGRPHERTENLRYNIDTNQPVYAIRGTGEFYQCNPTHGPPTGTNCSITHVRKGEGDCYLTTFGDWRCYMSDRNAVPNEVRDRPPPA
jgi:hypothetical protein